MESNSERSRHLFILCNYTIARDGLAELEQLHEELNSDRNLHSSTLSSCQNLIMLVSTWSGHVCMRHARGMMRTRVPSYVYSTREES